ncbi:MAG: hypothetical protein JO246_14965 [Frankiaceae bacterium]|nr:hypothetical protein [Frankiaceae bacterium]MBV9872569.1 hypothetical protein [Frankiaceae bacterium]
MTESGNLDGDAEMGAIVEWVEGAPQEQREAHDQALIWSLATERQDGRVRRARMDFMAEHERTLARGVYDDESAEPPRRMQSEIVLMFTAARQLLRALKSFDNNHRPRQGLDHDRVQLLRNALEHWDDPTGSALTKLAAQGVDPKDNRWRSDGSGIVGGIDDRELEAWARAVFDDIRTWDPWY